jgi:ADP-heptose:LPS heptosyltransferase
LVRHLLTEAVLIVDKGGSEEERGQINRLIEVVKAQDKVLVAVREDNAAAVLQAEALRADLLTWDGGIGAFAALVAGSDQYIGYDSAGQHIAAALGVPTLTIFATTGSPLFGQRWRPYGPGPIQVLSFDPSRPASATDLLNDTLPQALALHQSLRDREEIRTPDSGLRTPDSKNSA